MLNEFNSDIRFSNSLFQMNYTGLKIDRNVQDKYNGGYNDGFTKKAFYVKLVLLS